MNFINKFALILGWLVITFVILGILNIGVFRFSYQWSKFGELQFQTANLSVPQEVTKLIQKLK